MEAVTTQETVSLAVGDELVVGPAIQSATIDLTIETEGRMSVAVRDALARRDELIEQLRARVAELEGERRASAEELADAVVGRLREMVSP